MNFREMFFPVMLAMVITFGVQYFMEPQRPQKNNTGVSGQSFVAPEVQKVQKPLSLDVEFAKEKDQQVKKHVVKTSLANYTFSSKGAILESLDLLWQNNTKHVELISQGSECFLVGLDGASPLHYDFVKEYALQDKKATAVEYKASVDGSDVVKTFVVYDDTYQVDLRVAVDYKGQESQAIRVFFPMTADLATGSSMAGDYEFRGITNKANASGDIMLRDINVSKQIKEFVYEPKVFGFVDRFLIQSFVKLEGSDNPVRSYFKESGAKRYQAILESTAFEGSGKFVWSFYFGPKVHNAIQAVSPALLQTIDYGWFTFIAKPMLSVLIQLKNSFDNYGIAIILLTLLLNLFLLPFRLRGERGKAQKDEYDKKLAYIRQKYKHDKQALDAATAELLQKHGLGGISSCLPMFLNIPFFIALSRVLSGSFELYGADFLWLPDLSAKDPYYALGVLTALCMAATPVAGGPVAMRYASALFLGTVTTYLSSGLALFMFINALFALVQSFVMRILKKR